MKRVLGENWALPALEPLNRDFFTQGRVALQQCRTCAHVQHPPEEVCQACQGFDLDVFLSAGEGRVESVAVAHYPVHPALKDQVPYAIVVVSVNDAAGVLIVGNAVGVLPGEVRIGDSVRAVFEDVEDPVTRERLLIPQWEIVR